MAAKQAPENAAAQGADGRDKASRLLRCRAPRLPSADPMRPRSAPCEPPRVPRECLPASAVLPAQRPPCDALAKCARPSAAFEQAQRAVSILQWLTQTPRQIFPD